ncbi:hypothetical protein Maes01_02054 [Microbulbifer aestuariivivens]|uniref:GTP-binding protein n=1 Tax=Microbulbifer aestuariivivens TaxID=1908308 RepID=A0ABP9WQK0_9GAMM
MEYKIIFAGPVGAGKSTAISTISDVEVVSTESRASDDVSLRKETTTVAMDYGRLALGNGQAIHLYGTPGQERFSFMWEVLTIGGLGLVLLIDNAADDPLADMEFYLGAFAKFIRENAVAVGVTRMDLQTQPNLKQYNDKLMQLGIRAPVFEVDARRRDDISALLQALLVMLDPSIKR